MSMCHTYTLTGRKEAGDFVAKLTWDEDDGDDMFVSFSLIRIVRVVSGHRLIYDGMLGDTVDLDCATVLFYGHVNRRGCSELRSDRGGFHFDFASDLTKLSTALYETRKNCAKILGDQVWSEYE